MEKRFQVFVSSTYEDLQEERREVMQALLELDCIPAGMELFPASNDDQWSLIKKVIDDCDYYIVIIGGRYGSVNSDGISYTEMEYRYASERGKPIISFLHKTPEEIKSKFAEQSPEGKKKLIEFRDLAQRKMVKYWTNSNDLGSVVSRSMVKLIRDFPSIGWIKANYAANDISASDYLKLKAENDHLKQELELNNRSAPPLGTENLAQGDDEIQIPIAFKGDNDVVDALPLASLVTGTWNSLFASIAPCLEDSTSEPALRQFIVEHFQDLAGDYLIKLRLNKYSRLYDFSISSKDFHMIKIQLRALGLIKKCADDSFFLNSDTCWKLTEYGDQLMMQLIAIKKQDT